MTPTRTAALPALALALLGLAGCGEDPSQRSLVGDFAAPEIYALAGDTLTVWKRTREPSGASRFQSYAITPGGTVEYFGELERVGAPEDPETAADFREHRKSFALPQSEFEAIRAQAALLRPRSLGPGDPVAGYGGEAVADGCRLDPQQPRIAGINFLNRVNWGGFVLQSGCDSPRGKAAARLMSEIFARLERVAGPVEPAAN